MEKKKISPPSQEFLESMRTVFNSFDKDNSGTIDKSEVKLAAKELGQDISDGEINKIFAEIDKNKDKKISFNEFSDWWYYGKVNKLEKLVFLKLKVLNLLQKNQALQSRLGRILADKYEEKMDKIHFCLRFGNSEHKTKLGVKLGVGKPSEFQFKAMTEGMNLNPSLAIVLKMRVLSDPKNAEESLRGLINKLQSDKKAAEHKEEAQEGEEEEIAELPISTFLQLVDFEVKSDEDYVYLGITSHEPFFTDAAEATTSAVLEKLNEQFHSDIELSFSLKNDLNVLLNEKSNEKLILSLLEGFAFTLTGNINSDFAKNFRKDILFMAEMMGDELSPGMKNMFLLSLLKGLKVDIELDELEKEKIEKVLTNIGSLPALKATPSFIQILDLLKNKGIPKDEQSGVPGLNDLITFIRTHLKSEIEVYVKVFGLLCVVSFKTSGVSECYDYVIDRNE